MTRWHDHIPGWPPLAGAAALLAGAVAGVLATLMVAVVAATVGMESVGPGVTVAVALLAAAGTLAAVLGLARLTRPPTPAHLGLRPAAAGRALAWLAGAALAFAAIVAAWSLAVDLRGALPVPAELDPRSDFARQYGLPLREPVALDLGFVASLLVRVIVPAVVGEILLRGFAFPALSRWRGPVPAALIVAVLFGGVADLGSDAAVAVPSMLLGGILCALYVGTGSLLPGIALSAGASGGALAAACAWPATGVGMLAVACSLGALALVAPFAGLRPTPRRRVSLGAA